MKIKQLLLLLSVIFLLSCSKDESATSTYFLTCDIDGVASKFNVNTVAGWQEEAGVKALSIGGFNNAGTDPDGLGFIIINAKSLQPIVARTYTDTDSAYELLGSHTIAPGAINFMAGANVVEEAEHDGVTIVNHLVLNITELNTVSVKGTFSGDFYPDDDFTVPPLKITNGKFHVKLIN